LYILNCWLKPKLESHNMGWNVHAGKASEVLSLICTLHEHMEGHGT
jgi:hypothetical protein